MSVFSLCSTGDFMCTKRILHYYTAGTAPFDAYSELETKICCMGSLPLRTHVLVCQSSAIMMQYKLQNGHGRKMSKPRPVFSLVFSESLVCFERQNLVPFLVLTTRTLPGRFRLQEAKLEARENNFGGNSNFHWFSRQVSCSSIS